MHVTPLTADLEPKFWRHINQDPRDFYFFILDWTMHKNQTKIYLALNPADEILGGLLVFQDRIAQLRGACESTEQLLGFCPETVTEFVAPFACKDTLLEQLREPELVEVMDLLCLQRGEETLRIGVEPSELDDSDVGAVVELMQQTYPEQWSDMSAKSLRSMFNAPVWVGIKEAGRLVSLGVASVTPAGSHICYIATHKAYRNRGYATSIVSVLTQKLLEKAPMVSINVMEENVAAVTAYRNVGFKFYTRYVHVKRRQNRPCGVKA
ncbi:MAG: GNAT family N-acetyltransferase [Candidatus Bathyarchaeota archaeon]|nr:GNAT family N-acetyltransferase [Candidatus Bathyarchaeota archaeon]